MKFKGEVEVTKVDNRTDKPPAEGETGAPGFYVKVKSELPIDDLSEMFSTPDSFERLLGALYRKSGELETLDLGRLDLNVTGINLKAKIKTAFGDPMDFKGAEIDNIKISPMANRMAGFKARLKLNKPTDEQMARVLHAQGQGITLSISGRTSVEEADDAKTRQGDMLKGGKAAKEEDETEDAGAPMH